MTFDLFDLQAGTAPSSRGPSAPGSPATSIVVSKTSLATQQLSVSQITLTVLLSAIKHMLNIPVPRNPMRHFRGQLLLSRQTELSLFLFNSPKARMDNQVIGYKDLAAIPKDKAILEVERPDLMVYEPHFNISALDRMGLSRSREVRKEPVSLQIESLFHCTIGKHLRRFIVHFTTST